MACFEPQTAVKNKEETELIGVWVTYSEIDAMVKSDSGFKEAFRQAAEKMCEFGINTVYFHTVAFGSSVYPSEIYPMRYENGEDILYEAIEICNQFNIELHAWINPYRLQTSSANTDTLPEGFAKKWLTDGNPINDKNVCFTENGIYLNPASSEVRNLIINGIREIVNGYGVAGIHFDDYFYPTTSSEFDSDFYEEYVNSTEVPLTLDEWRRANVNTLLLGVYGAIKSNYYGLKFGISPAADLNRCYNVLYADIEGWIGGGYIDYIIPQLYFGFEYPDENYRFDNLLTKWLDLTNGKNVKLYCGLAMYKSGTDAEPDYTEWQHSNDIIARQIELLRENRVSGFALFSYSSVFKANEANARQAENIKEVL